jgi:hypothetical protein
VDGGVDKADAAPATRGKSIEGVGRVDEEAESVVVVVDDNGDEEVDDEAEARSPGADFLLFTRVF